MAQILVVDDEKSVRTTLSITLSRAKHSVDTAASGEEAVVKIGEQIYDLVITDLKMSKLDGLGVLGAVKERDPETEVVLMSAYGSIETAVTAMREGAHDYMEKPFTPDEVLHTVELALERRELRTEVRSLKRDLNDPNDPQTIIGESSSLSEVLSLVDDWAQSDSTILLTGETGTGKDLFARSIQQKSQRAERPFVVVNCATIPKALFESELFGHVKGAYSGAGRNRKGLCHEAHKGTLFLDEIGELPLDVQPQLLRFLESGEIRPLGQNATIKVDVRVIAATNRDLLDMVKEKSFREDLYYRLNVLPLELPPLRDRRSDIRPIVERCLQRFARRLGRETKGLSNSGWTVLEGYDWPGNIRELENVMERAVMLARGGEITPKQLVGLAGSSRDDVGGGVSVGDAVTVAEIERAHILGVLEGCGNNQRQAAKVLHISKSTLWRKLKEYGVTVTKD